MSNEPAVGMLDAISELGELAKALLSESNYGQRPAFDSENIRE